MKRTETILALILVILVVLGTIAVGTAQPVVKTRIDVSTRERLEFAKSLAVSAVQGGSKYVSHLAMGHETVSSPRDVARYCRDLSDALYDSYENEEEVPVPAVVKPKPKLRPLTQADRDWLRTGHAAYFDKESGEWRPDYTDQPGTPTNGRP